MIYPPEISVVLPVYNGEKHIKNCILSILNQSFKNFELIIINDGSTDQTVSLISSFSDDRLKLVTQENTGIGGALRRGCNVAVGKYILRIDADDICLPNRFIVQKHFLDSRPNVVMLGGASIYVDEEGLEIGRSYPYTSNFILKSMLIKYSPFCHPTVIFRKNAYIEAGGYQALEPLEDVDLWLKLSKLGEIKNLCSPVIKNTIVGNSISRSISIKQSNQLRIKLMKMIGNQVPQIQINKIFKDNYDSIKRDKSIINYTKEEALLKKNKTHFLENYLSGGFYYIKLNEKSINLIITTLKNIFGFFRFYLCEFLKKR